MMNEMETTEMKQYVGKISEYSEFDKIRNLMYKLHDKVALDKNDYQLLDIIFA